jgi:hypothetical protein
VAADVKVYRCSGERGDEYRDVPCNEHQERRDSAEYKVASGVFDTLSLRTLAGQWCNYAKAESLFGERNYSDLDRWSIGMNGTLVIKDLDQAADNYSSQFRFQGRNLVFDDKKLGYVSVIEYSGEEMILLGKEGYLFMQRGGCSNIVKSMSSDTFPDKSNFN